MKGEATFGRRCRGGGIPQRSITEDPTADKAAKANKADNGLRLASCPGNRLWKDRTGAIIICVREACSG